MNELDNIIDTTEVENITDIVPAESGHLSLSPEEFQQALIEKIINAEDRKELQEHLDLFNLAQSKNNVLRAIKLNDLLAKVEDQAIERFTKKPDQISNKELLEYFQVISTQIEKSQKLANETISEKPLIQINNNKNELNINTTENLSKENKENIIDAVTALMKQLETIDKSKLSIESDSQAETQTLFIDKNEE